MAGKKRGASKAAKKAKSQGPVNEKLMKALSHKTRVQALSILNERAASPSELSEALNQDLSKVSYHIKVLRDYELVELVRTEPRRGAVEHFYRATHRALLPTGLWKGLSQGTRQDIYTEILGDVYDDVESALKAGTFDARENFHLSWTPTILDAQGWEDLATGLDEFLDRVLDVQAETATRLAESKESGISATFVLVGFESARSPKEGKKASMRKRG